MGSTDEHKLLTMKKFVTSVVSVVAALYRDCGSVGNNLDNSVSDIA